MLIEKLIFNAIAFSLFVFIFFKIIRKNDTAYVSILIISAIGILLNFLEILLNFPIMIWYKLIMYILSIIIPGIIILLEVKGLNYSELYLIAETKFLGIIGDSKKQKEVLNKFVKNYPETSYIGHKKLGEIYEKEGGMRKAIDEYVQAVEINKTDYNTYYKISFLLNELNKKEEALIMLNNLLKVKPDHFDALQLNGDILCSSGRYKEALNIYANILRYYPNRYEAYYNMGMTYTLLTDFANAKAYYEKATEINNTLYNAYYSLAQINMIYGDLDEAELYFQKCLLDKEAEARFIL